MAVDDSKERDARLQQMLSKLKNHDCRITPQRLAVLRARVARSENGRGEMAVLDGCCESTLLWASAAGLRFRVRK